MNLSYLSCPNCRSTLAHIALGFSCATCKKEFPVVEGIPVLSVNREYRFSPTPRDWLEKEISDVRQVGYTPAKVDSLFQSIIDSVPNSRRREWIENLVDETRAAGKYLLHLQPDSHVLNLGCGWDNTTINLARTCARVTAIDLTLERIQLLNVKKQHYNLKNIDLFCGGDTQYLPFSNNTFDAVFLNGVLEWVASSGFSEKVRSMTSGKVVKFFKYLLTVYTKHRPAKIQQAFLREICRVLKPSGQIFIGIENRFSRKYFAGRPDDHSYIKYTSLYPRLLAHLVLLLRSHKPYLVFTYGRQGHKRLLSHAGFQSHRFYSIEPCYQLPRRIVDLHNSRQVDMHLDQKSGPLRVLPKQVYLNTVPCFGIVASKSSELPSFFTNLLEQYNRISGREFVIKSIDVKQKAKVILQLMDRVDESVQVVTKIPLTPWAKAACDNNFQMLDFLAKVSKDNLGLSSLIKLLPKSIYKGSLGNQTYYIESAGKGTPWNTIEPTTDDLKHGNEMLQILNAASAVRLPASFATVAAKGLCEELLYFCTNRNMSHLKVIMRLKEMFHEVETEREGWSLRMGDLTISNILVDAGRISCVYDLDDWYLGKFPYANVAEFCFSFLRRRRQMLWAECMAEVLGGSVESFGSLLNLDTSQFETKLTDDELHLSAITFWLDDACYVARHEVARLNRKRVEVTITAVLEQIAKRLSK